LITAFYTGGTNPFSYTGDSGPSADYTRWWTYESMGASDTLNLGNLAPGDTITLRYSMKVSVTAPPFEAGAIATIGDPNNLLGTPGVTGTLTGPGVVPLPSAVWMGLALLGGLAASRRLRRRR
jgi:hypothetical protein